MIYELRSYEAVPGKLPALNARGKQTADFFKKHGIGMLGWWTSEIGTSNQLICILSFDSVADREKKWDAWHADSDWHRVRAESEKDGPLMVRVRNSLMRLTPYSPEPRISTNVQELRIYEAAAGKLPLLHDRFANHTTGFFKKHGMEVVGYWTEDVGTSNQLVYMLGYPSLGDRESSWAAFSTDPDWRKIVDESHEDGVLVSQNHNMILRPTGY